MVFHENTIENGAQLDHCLQILAALTAPGHRPMADGAVRQFLPWQIFCRERKDRSTALVYGSFIAAYRFNNLYLSNNISIFGVTHVS